MSNIQPLGPSGVRDRIAQIEARIAQVTGKPMPATAHVNVNLGEIGFGDEPALQGEIGATPFNPLGSGATLTGDRANPEIKSMIETAALNNNIDPNLLDAVVATESSYNPGARSGFGAMGLTQLMPMTAKAMGVSNPFDPMQNLNGGAKYLSGLLARYGDLATALAAYNAGPSNVDRHGGMPPHADVRAYVDRVMKLYTQKGRQ